jgi:hypothetical protein
MATDLLWSADRGSILSNGRNFLLSTKVRQVLGPFQANPPFRARIVSSLILT